MESAHLHQGAELQGSLEIRLPWVISSAWQTLLNNTPLDFETSKELDPQLKDQAQDVLGKSLCQQIRGFVADPYLTSMIERNCPRDRDVPPTPYSGVLSPRSTPVACLVSLTMQSLMGINPVVYEGENDGRLFRHVIPSRHSSSHKSSHGSRLRFSYHVDNPDLPLSSEPLGATSCCPEYLSFFRGVLETRRFDEPHLLLPGDFMVFKNQRVLHARDGFEPQNDGADRWLLRLFAVNDLNRVHFARADHLYEVLS